jgi:hypothetical protein
MTESTTPDEERRGRREPQSLTAVSGSPAAAGVGDPEHQLSDRVRGWSIGCRPAMR